MAPMLDAPPPALVDAVIDSVHGVDIIDPYRWLENQDSAQTRAWLREQDAHTRAYFDRLPSLALIHSRVTELLSPFPVSELWSVGDRYFFLQRYPDREQAVIVLKEGTSDEEKSLVDPAEDIGDTRAAVAICAISRDGRFLAYSLRRGGTDHSAIKILDVERNTVLADYLSDGFCTGFCFDWKGTGFYYCHRELRDSRPKYKAVLWHRFGTDRAADVEVFFAGEEQNLFVGILDSPEAGILLFPVFSAGKNPDTSIYLYRPTEGTAPSVFTSGIEGCFVPFFAGNQLLAYTDLDAPNCRIVRIDLNNPQPARWRNIVPESNRRIQQFAVAGDQVFVTRVNCFHTEIEAFGLTSGERKHALFSVPGTINLLTPTTQGKRLFYSHESVCKPPAVYSYCPYEEQSCPWQEITVPPDPFCIETRETSYRSSDGTSIPLFLACRKDLMHAGPLPTFLTGYGGFGSCVTPRFTAFATFLIEQGFLLAVPALRGGSELGELWHRAGKRENRQNSFDDFIAAAEFLLAQGHSAPGRMAIGGGSNAGLLVGAAITQRPDLFRAAICLGPLLDMTRYHLFDFAAGWAEEYGSPEDEQDLRYLLAYSPYHHVQDGADYPAILLISGDADTRCNPMHARKMAARLQAANRSEHPILLDYKTAWGHTPVQPLSVKIGSLTERLAFICHELGVEPELRRNS